MPTAYLLTTYCLPTAYLRPAYDLRTTYYLPTYCLPTYYLPTYCNLQSADCQLATAYCALTTDHNRLNNTTPPQLTSTMTATSNPTRPGDDDDY